MRASASFSASVCPVAWSTSAQALAASAGGGTVCASADSENSETSTAMRKRIGKTWRSGNGNGGL
jgi:hypothetical protein